MLRKELDIQSCCGDGIDTINDTLGRDLNSSGFRNCCSWKTVGDLGLHYVQLLLGYVPYTPVN